MKFFKYHKDGGKGDPSLLIRSTDVPISARQNYRDPLQLTLKPPPEPFFAAVSTRKDPLLMLKSKVLQKKQDFLATGGKPVVVFKKAVDDPLQVLQRKEPVDVLKIDRVQKANFKPVLANFMDQILMPVVIPDTLIQPAKRAPDVLELPPKKDPKTFLTMFKDTVTITEFQEYQHMLQRYRLKRYSQFDLIARLVNMLFPINPKFDRVMIQTRVDIFKEYGAFVGSKYREFYLEQLERISKKLL